MHDGADYTEFVTFTTAGQLFGVPIGRVQDVFKPSHITPVPLAGAEIAGVLNLRGRIVTMIDLRRRLELEQGENDRTPMPIGIEARGESLGLLVDAVGEVLNLPNAEREGVVSTSIASSPPYRPACTGSMDSSWSFSTSTWCSTCAR
jgi:purine-binding chemotaxis protein CheW